MLGQTRTIMFTLGVDFFKNNPAGEKLIWNLRVNGGSRHGQRGKPDHDDSR